MPDNKLNHRKSYSIVSMLNKSLPTLHKYKNMDSLFSRGYSWIVLSIVALQLLGRGVKEGTYRYISHSTIQEMSPLFEMVPKCILIKV